MEFVVLRFSDAFAIVTTTAAAFVVVFVVVVVNVAAPIHFSYF